jgi:hypothetical protein
MSSEFQILNYSSDIVSFISRERLTRMPTLIKSLRTHWPEYLMVALLALREAARVQRAQDEF